MTIPCHEAALQRPSVDQPDAGVEREGRGGGPGGSAPWGALPVPLLLASAGTHAHTQPADDPFDPPRGAAPRGPARRASTVSNSVT
eukprot:CAMPEP_0174378286 /NCGR_PEP_ID=MMETSP0811_2-20130205/121953_1 /TAXON_ID=73025 ORGANISM="Eutreptiella gymnastica-like, Strain CCMP1594" /NCGR_SAMPLE_ID=MMETSP0811_2 /ASSEMBLY_ACC=CAM_ASM_000667 /LENGTH=85 /DNA_ID=CAMNT_0015530461 /DNA_START=3322 /DNA_END=3580 /DNA_ORIENTATION=-